MTSNPNPRTTPRGAQRAAQAKAKVDANAARVVKLNEAQSSTISFVEGVGTVATPVTPKPATTKSNLGSPDATKRVAAQKDMRARAKRAPRKLNAIELAAERHADAIPLESAPKGPAKANASMSTSSDQAKISKLTALLTAAENAVNVATDKTIEAATAKRDRLMLDMIAASATFAQIAAARGVPYSTNRGLIRVLQGGKRI